MSHLAQLEKHKIINIIKYLIKDSSETNIEICYKTINTLSSCPNMSNNSFTLRSVHDILSVYALLL